MLQLLTQTGRLRSELLNLTVFSNRLFVLLHRQQNVTSLEVGLDVLLIDVQRSLQICHCFVIASHLCKPTRFIVQNCHVVGVVERIELQTFVIDLKSAENALLVTLFEQFASLFLLLFSLLHALPEFLVLWIVVVLESLFDVLLAHVNLTIVHQDAATPEEKLGILNEVVLDLGRERDRVGEVVGALVDHSLEEPTGVLDRICRFGKNVFVQILGLAPFFFFEGFVSVFLVSEVFSDLGKILSG